MKKDEIIVRRGESLVLAAVWMGGLANKTMIETLRSKLDLPQFKEVHLEMFSYVDPDGTTITEIAKRKGVTKQSISKTVQELVDMGFLETREHPQDSRSKLVSFKLTEGSAMRQGFAALAKIDTAIAQLIGARKYESLLDTMQTVIGALDQTD